MCCARGLVFKKRPRLKADLVPIAACLHDKMGSALQSESGKDAGGVPAGIEANAAVIGVDVLRWCMPMDNHLVEASAVLEKAVADPQHVLGKLCVQVYARPHASMNKKIVADSITERQGFEKL